MEPPLPCSTQRHSLSRSSPCTPPPPSCRPAARCQIMNRRASSPPQGRRVGARLARLGGALHPPHQLRKHLQHGAAPAHEMRVVPVRGDHRVALLQRRLHAHHHRLLPVVPAGGAGGRRWAGAAPVIRWAACDLPRPQPPSHIVTSEGTMILLAQHPAPTPRPLTGGRSRGSAWPCTACLQRSPCGAGGTCLRYRTAWRALGPRTDGRRQSAHCSAGVGRCQAHAGTRGKTWMSLAAQVRRRPPKPRPPLKYCSSSALVAETRVGGGSRRCVRYGLTCGQPSWLDGEDLPHTLRSPLNADAGGAAGKQGVRTSTVKVSPSTAWVFWPWRCCHRRSAARHAAPAAGSPRAAAALAAWLERAASMAEALGGSLGSERFWVFGKLAGSCVP